MTLWQSSASCVYYFRDLSAMSWRDRLAVFSAVIGPLLTTSVLVYGDAWESDRMIAVTWRIIVAFMWLVLAAQISVYVRGFRMRSHRTSPPPVGGSPKAEPSRMNLIWSRTLAAVWILLAIVTRERDLFLPALFLGMFFNGLSDYTIENFRMHQLRSQA
jgi:hypothetical protein